MPLPKVVDSKVAKKLLETLEEALGLLEEFRSSNRPALPKDQSVASLMEQCLALCDQPHIEKREPIRTISHFACTGGTLVSKCIAAMPNVQLLSEINPFSTTNSVPNQPSFAPTDVIKQMRQSTRGASNILISELFLSNLEIIYSESNRKGLHLVLRDHAHSQFCTGSEVSTCPTLSALVSSRFDTLSVITVRHPLQSYISAGKHNWLHFQPQTFEEYCKRYLAFLRSHSDNPVFKYEDLVHDPAPTMSRICDSLKITFSDKFDLLFNAFNLTGDSGRGKESDVIQPLEDKKADEPLVREANESHYYPILLEYLGYR